MNDEITYSKAEDGDLEEIFLFHQRYTGDLRPISLWLWEYSRSNPNGSVLIMGRLNKRLIVTQGMVCIPLIVSKLKVRSGKNESLLVDDTMRGKGIMTSMYPYAFSEYQKQEIKCLWGFSKNALTPVKKMDFIVFSGILRQAILCLKPLRVYRSYLSKTQKLSSRIVLWSSLLFAWAYGCLIRTFFMLAKARNDILLKPNLTDPTDIEKLYARIREKFPLTIHIDLTPEFQSWRLDNAPEFHERLYAYENTQLVGYLIYILRERFLEIVDLSFASPQAGKSLVTELFTLVKSKQPDMVIYTGNYKNQINLQVFQLLSSVGFITRQAPNDFVMKVLDNNYQQIFEKEENWYLNGLWFEGN